MKEKFLPILYNNPELQTNWWVSLKLGSPAVFKLSLVS
jgi:hypothetical protein